MKTIRQINIKNKQGYFFNDMTNISDFDPSLLNIDEVTFKIDELVMYDIKCIKDVLKCIKQSLSCFYNLDACIEKSDEYKYLIFALTKKNKLMLRSYAELWEIL